MLDVDIEMMSSFRIFLFWQTKLNEDKIEKLKAEVLLLINFIIFKGVFFLRFFLKLASFISKFPCEFC